MGMGVSRVVVEVVLGSWPVYLQERPLEMGLFLMEVLLKEGGRGDPQVMFVGVRGLLRPQLAANHLPV